MKTTEERIKVNEGLRLKSYKDTLGNWTVGYGHLLGQGSSLANVCITNDIADCLFREDFLEAEANALSLFTAKVFGAAYDWDVGERAKVIDVLTEMCFVLGFRGAAKFKKFLAACAKQNWEQAKAELIDSLWYKQCPNRVKQLCNLL